jgi:hypothetical protein
MSIETIKSTLVRHDWKKIEAGTLSGKRYLVECHGQPVAAIVPASEVVVKTRAFDLNRYFAALKKRPALPDHLADPRRSGEI